MPDDPDKLDSCNDGPVSVEFSSVDLAMDNDVLSEFEPCKIFDILIILNTNQTNKKQIQCTDKRNATIYNTKKVEQ